MKKEYLTPSVLTLLPDITDIITTSPLNIIDSGDGDIDSIDYRDLA